jgi:hypothetical protein
MKSSSIGLGVLLIGLLVFGYAEVCRAEGAWVLWEGIDKKVGSDTIWTIESAFPSYKLCTDRIKNICGTGSMDYSSNTCTKFNFLGYAAWYYKCLPDMVDPRKGKGVIK